MNECRYSESATRLARVRCVAGLVADAVGACAGHPELLDVSAVAGLLRRVQAADLTAGEVAQVRRALAPVSACGVAATARGAE